MESLAKQGDVEAIWRLESPPPLSNHVAHLWSAYMDPVIGLAHTRTVGMGPNRLTRAEIRQYEIDEGITFARWERRAIMALDAEHLRIMNESLKRGREKS